MKTKHYKIINKKKRILVQSADRLLDLARACRLMASEDSPELASQRDSIRKILIVRLAYIGDVVMTLPVIEPLRQAFPDASIDFLTSRMAAPLLRHHPWLDSVIEFNAPWFYRGRNRDSTSAMITKIQQSGYDLGIDFRGDVRNILHCLYRPRVRNRLSYTSGGGGALLTHSVGWDTLKHKVEYHLDLLRRAGIDAPVANPKIHLLSEEIERARELMQSLPGCGDRAPVVVHPGARLALKKWPASLFIDLIRQIVDSGRGPVVLLEVPDTAIGNEIAEKAPIVADLRGRFSIREMAAFMSVARVVICHDSGPMHIAAAVGARVVALFGPSRPIETAPCGQGHVVIEAACERKDACDECNCLLGTNGCMERISVSDVLRAID